MVGLDLSFEGPFWSGLACWLATGVYNIHNRGILNMDSSNVSL